MHGRAPPAAEDQRQLLPGEIPGMHKHRSEQAPHARHDLAGAVPVLNPLESLARDPRPSPHESCLNVNLLKERIELELSLKREGLRFLLTLLFGFLFAYVHLFAFAPTDQYETSWLITERLGLAKAERLASTREAYGALMETARSARAFYPLSSVYVANGLAKTILEGRKKFLNGPRLVPLDNHPTLPMEWTVYFRLRLDDYKNTKPKRLQLMSQRIKKGGADFTCWGLYSEGLYKYVLVYGGHNLEGGAVELGFTFDRDTAHTNPLGLSLLALTVNATHATVMLEDAGEMFVLEDLGKEVLLPGVVSQQLPDGTQPTDCRGGNYYLGAEGLELANFEFRPFELTEATFHNVQEVGQPLSQLVIGASRPPAPEADQQNSYQTEAHRTTHDLVLHGADTLEGLVRLSGAITTEGAEDTGLLKDELLAPDTEGALGPNSTESEFLWLSDAEPMVSILAEGEVMQLPRGTPPVNSSLSASLSDAFAELMANGQDNFTLSWWAAASLIRPDDAEETREMITFEDGAGSGLPHLTVEYVHGGKLPSSGGWIVRFNGAPTCLDPAWTSTEALLCQRSPSFWCQASDSGTHDGLWRHFALRFSQHADAATQSLDVLQDGKRLCGVSFPAEQGMLPHRSTGSLRVGMEDRGNAAGAALALQAVELYSQVLTSRQIMALASNPNLQECLPLDTLTDNPNYTTSFGQSCADLAEQRSGAESATSEAGICTLPSAIENCPVSCRNTSAPLCFDGLVSPPAPEESPFGAVTKALLLEPAARAARFPDYGDDAYWSSLQQHSKAQWLRRNDQRQDWVRLSSMVENLEYGTVVTANDLKGRTPSDPIWRVPAASGDGLRCPGKLLPLVTMPCPQSREELGMEVFGDICSSEQTHQGIMKDMLAQGRSSDDINIAANFESGMMAVGESFSMFVWARRVGKPTVHLAGIDAENNLCFDFNHTHGMMMRRNLLAGGVVDNAEEALRSGFFSTELAQSRQSSGAKGGGEWTFFALSVDVENEYMIFAIDDSYTKVHLAGLSRGEWGCNDLKFIVNLGGDISVSPISVRRSSMTVSDVQRLHLATRRVYRHMVGPRRSKRDRLTPRERRREPFTSPVVGIAPPLLLQRREEPAVIRGEVNMEDCEDAVSSKMSTQLLEERQKVCGGAYQCTSNNAILPSECSQRNVSAIGVTNDGEFFGRVAQRYKGKEVYPEFAWSLDNDILVRDGKVLFPVDNYVDDRTLSIRVLTCLYNYKTMVAAILEADYSLRGLEVVKTVSVKQSKLLTPGEYRTWQLFMSASTVLALLILLLALPAAIEEIKTAVRRFQRAHNSVVTKMGTMTVSRRWTISKFKLSNPMSYTADTTQPDILDVLFFLAIVLLLVSELILRKGMVDGVTAAFGDLSEQQWGSPDRTFAEEMSVFMDRVKRADVQMTMETNVKMVSFVVLLMLGVRLVVFMKVHPRVATITRTFETVGTELLNFLFSFGIIFVFMALTAHLRFGAQMQAFSTFRRSLLTQFMVLLTVDLPDFGKDIFMTIYVVGYVVLCALSLLNFFLAIVVNGYTKVSEDVLENKVVNSIGKDVLLVIRDVWLWPARGWIHKAAILNVLARAYPHIFENGYNQADTYKEELLTREECVDLFIADAVTNPESNSLRRPRSPMSRLASWLRLPSGGWTPRAARKEEDPVDVAATIGDVHDHYTKQFNKTVLVASRMSVDIYRRQVSGNAAANAAP
eukprot:jgi/Tetstr1/444023/TSEL_031963.t1